MSQDHDEVTSVLAAIAGGDQSAAARLLPLVYDELHRLAQLRMGRERPDHTLQPTALVHEAFLRLVGGGDPGWQNRAHFFGAAAIAMRRILIENARRRDAAKYGGGRAQISLSGVDLADDPDSLDLLALDEALSRLEKQDPRMSQIVHLRYFAGLSVEEAAEALNISPRTVKRDWNLARAWLYREIKRGDTTNGDRSRGAPS